MTVAEFETMIADFLAEYEAADGWYEGEWLVIEALIHCRTDGCVRKDIPELAPFAVPVDGVWKAVCGRCSKPIEDINPQLSDDPDYRLPTRFPDGSSWMVTDD